MTRSSLLPDTAEVAARRFAGDRRLPRRWMLVAEFGTPAVHLRRGPSAGALPRGGRRVRRRACGVRDEGVPVQGDGPPRLRRGHVARRRQRRRDVRRAGRRRAGRRAAPSTATTRASTSCARRSRNGVRHIVVDSFDELDRLDALHAEGLPVPKVLARITPGRARPHPRVHRHRSGRLEVRLQPRQRRRATRRRSHARVRRASIWSACTATSAPTCSPPPTSPRRPR